MFSKSLHGPLIAALVPWMGLWDFVCMTSRRLLGAVMCGQAVGGKLVGTMVSGLTSLRGHWGLPGPEQVVVRDPECAPITIRERTSPGQGNWEISGGGG